jgi:hypothetical protein
MSPVDAMQHVLTLMRRADTNVALAGAMEKDG